MNVYHNDPDNFIDDQEYFSQYHYWLISEHKFANIKTSITHIINVQLYGRSNYHVFTNINIFTYIRPVNYNVQIINDSKAPEKYFGLDIIKKQKRPRFTTLDIIIHTKKTAKHNNSNITKTLQPIRIFIIEALR